MSALVPPTVEFLVSDMAKEYCYERIHDLGIDNMVFSTWMDIKNQNPILHDILRYRMSIAEIQVSTTIDDLISAEKAFRLGSCISYLALSSTFLEVPILGPIGGQISLSIFQDDQSEALAASSLEDDPNLNKIIDTVVDDLANFSPDNSELEFAEKIAVPHGAGFTKYLLNTQYKLTAGSQYN